MPSYITFFTSWYVATPCEIPLAHEDLRAGQLISRVALVGDHGAVDEVRVGGALPSVGDLGQLGASVVPGHLFRRCDGRRGWTVNTQKKHATIKKNNFEWLEKRGKSAGGALLCSGFLSREPLQLQTLLLCINSAEEFGEEKVNTGLWC